MASYFFSGSFSAGFTQDLECTFQIGKYITWLFLTHPMYQAEREGLYDRNLSLWLFDPNP